MMIPLNPRILQSGIPVMGFMTRLAALVTCIFAIAIPAIYYNSTVTEIRHGLTMETAFLAKSIQQIIQTRPDMWEYESTRLMELVSQPSLYGERDERQICTMDGSIIARSDFVTPKPFITTSVTLFDSGVPVGTIEARRSIDVQVIITVLLGIFSSLFGYFMYRIFRTYPIKALDKMLVDLQIEKERTEKIFHAIGDGVISVDSNGKIQLINRTAESLVGRDASGAIGLPLEDVFTLVNVPEDPFREKGNINILVGKEGKEYVIEEHRTHVQEIDTGKNGTVIIFRDISGHDEAETVRENSKLSIERLRKGLGATVQAIAAIVETRDPYTAGHQRRVADLARTIATTMGLTTDQIDGIRMAASIHDIGKISIPAEILSKPTKLKSIESELIRDHPQAGYEILKDIDFPWPIARIVLEHHERINGSGYPKGLRGEETLIESKIIAVADVVEAIASHRPYRPALGIDIALEEIINNKGVLYDNEIVDTCSWLFNERGYKMQGD